MYKSYLFQYDTKRVRRSLRSLCVISYYSYWMTPPNKVHFSYWVKPLMVFHIVKYLFRETVAHQLHHVVNTVI